MRRNDGKRVGGGEVAKGRREVAKGEREGKMGDK